MASHDLFPADALPQLWQPPLHAKIPALLYGKRGLQKDLGRNGEITKKQTIIIMSTELGKWDKVMSVALSVPGVKVNRNEFLVAALNNLCSVEQLKQIADGNRPTDYLSIEVIDRLADSYINSHTTKVTALSAAAGLPGGWSMAATIPADLAQYYYHVFVLSQKMAYLYGFPDLTDENGALTEEAKNVMTLFAGAMMGVGIANEAIQELVKNLSKEIVKRLPKYALTKTVIYPIVKQVAKWIGIKLTKDSFAKGLGKVIPILGGVISGGLTYVTFKPGAKKLKKTLHECCIFMIENKSKDETVEFANYQEVDD